VLSVVDRIWAGGGRLAGLVDRNDVSSTIQLPFSSFVFIDILLLVVSLFYLFMCKYSRFRNH
jgi:hypothetical protein